MADSEDGMDQVVVDCVVVGAGWTGLAMAAALKAYGVKSFVLLEAGQRVGHFTEGNYERMRFHTPWHSLPCDGGMSLFKYPMFKRRNEILRYLEEYFTLHGLEPYMRFATKVTRIAQVRQGLWRVETDTEAGRVTYRCRYLAVCTSKNRVPHIPEIPGRADFKGRVLHSREYRTGRAFRGQDVLVVGSGNSAAEICSDLVEQGAGVVTMLVHGPRYFMPLPRLGLVSWVLRCMGKLLEENQFAEWSLGFESKGYWDGVHHKDHSISLLVSDMSKHGIITPSIGWIEGQCRYGRVGTFDQGAISMIRKGRVKISRGKLTALMPNGAWIDGGTEIPVDAVVLATGFKPGLEDFLAEPDRFLARGQEGKGCGTEHRTPRTDGRSRSVVDDSLFFPSFDQALNGGLAMGFWGWSCGYQVAQGLGILSAEGQFSLDALPERQRDVIRRHYFRRILMLLAVCALAVGVSTRSWQNLF